MEMRLGESTRRLRKESGFTQEQLAEALGVSVGAVHKWESGKAPSELEMLIDIAEFFETSVDVIDTESGSHFVFHSRLNRDLELRRLVDQINGKRSIRA